MGAARTALSTHDRLREVYEREPNSETDPNAWLAWHDTEYKPAYWEWDRAMDALDAAGYAQHNGSRHPANFRPYCLDVLAS